MSVQRVGNAIQRLETVLGGRSWAGNGLAVAGAFLDLSALAPTGDPERGHPESQRALVVGIPAWGGASAVLLIGVSPRDAREVANLQPGCAGVVGCFDRGAQVVLSSFGGSRVPLLSGALDSTLRTSLTARR
jgi:hypothetical protein